MAGTSSPDAALQELSGIGMEWQAWKVEFWYGYARIGMAGEECNSTLRIERPELVRQGNKKP